MENLEIAALLGEFADLLEIRGANPFRIRAYRNAVRTVAESTRPIVTMLEEGEDLQNLPGIGKDLARYLAEIVESGTFGRLEEVAREVPRSLTVLVRLQGLGPKKVKKLWKELGIETIDALEDAANDGRLEELEGFGRRSVEKVLRSVQDLRSLQGRFGISEAEELVRGVLEHLRGAPGLERLEIAGSLRRRRETIGDVDILVQAEDGPAVVSHFVRYTGAVRIEAAGGTKGSLVLRSGLQVDLRVIPAASWGAALHYFTGSKEHNVSVRQRALGRGLRVNEWGVFEVETVSDDDSMAPTLGVRVAGESEEDVFDALDLPWIVPELRENRGEVEVAESGGLPKLVTLEDIRGDLQMHSTWSDGKNTLREMAEACQDRGYEYMSITDHSPSLAMVRGLTPERVRLQWEEIEEVREGLKSLHLFRSIEVDILRDGTLDLPDEILEGMDVVLVSVHSFMDLSQADMTDRVIRALRHPAVDILGHPTGRIINKRKPFALDVDAVLQVAGDLDVAVELNANPRRLDLSDVQVRRAQELGVKVVVSTDAHSVTDLDVMRYGVDQARRGWLEPSDVLNAMPIADFKAWTERRSS